MNLLTVQIAIAYLAALQKLPDAAALGDAAAKRLLDEGAWDFIQHTTYLAKSAEARLAFWASGAPLQSFHYNPGLLAAVRAGYESSLGPLLPGSTAFAALKLLENAYAAADDILNPQAPAPAPAPTSNAGLWIGIVVTTVTILGVGAAIVTTRETPPKHRRRAA